MGLRASSVDCENACKALAQQLRDEAETWDKRATDIVKNKALKAKRMQLPIAVRIAKRAVHFNHYGMDAIQYCIEQSRLHHANIDQVQQLFSQYLKASESDKRLRRNRHILYMVQNTDLSYVQIGLKFSLTSGQISKIITGLRRADAQIVEPKPRPLPVKRSRPTLPSRAKIDIAISRAAAYYANA